MTEIVDDEKNVDSIDLPYGGSYYKASLRADYVSERRILSYRGSSDIRPSLPIVLIPDGQCQIEINYLDKDGNIENSMCVMRNKFLQGNRQFFVKLPVYQSGGIYYANTEIIKSGKLIAVPIFDNPSVYYLVKKKKFDKDEIDTYYSIYTDIYWNRYNESAKFPYSMFQRLSTSEIIGLIKEVNQS